MPQINKLLYDLINKLDYPQRKVIKIGSWRLCPNKILTWQYKDDKRSIYVMFQGSNMGYTLTTEEEYLQVKHELDNYNF